MGGELEGRAGSGRRTDTIRELSERVSGPNTNLSRSLSSPVWLPPITTTASRLSFNLLSQHRYLLQVLW